MREEYFEWLYRLVCASTRPDASFHMLLKTLYRKEFFSLVPNDDNRGAEGVELRNEFRRLEHPELSISWFKAPSTVLEMLIALSHRMEFLFIGTELAASYDKWFWEMIDNLGLGNTTDSVFFDGDGTYIIDEILNTFLERAYDADGRGGLFPLEKPRLDQREVELWYQMNYYASEKLEGHW